MYQIVWHTLLYKSNRFTHCFKRIIYYTYYKTNTQNPLTSQHFFASLTRGLLPVLVLIPSIGSVNLLPVLLNLLQVRSSPNHSDGNFCEIVYLLSRHNPVIKSWLENHSSRKYQKTYMSLQSQNEFIMLLGEEIKGIISDKVNQSGFCSVMADTKPDVSHSNELSVAVRFVDSETLEPEERLVRVSETNDKTGDGQAKDIVKSLQISNIPLSTIQFQTYDSTASMSGVHNGALQKLNEILARKIPYTKCVPRGLNLVIEHGCEAATLISKVYDVLEQLFVFFTKSTKRNKELKDKLNHIENALQLRNLSKTRWAAHAEAVKAVWTSFNAIVEVLRILESSGDRETKTKASGLYNAMVNIDFICGLMFLKNNVQNESSV